jgi:large subunit ribosomal protein L22
MSASTRDRSGVRATARFARFSPYKAREVLDLIRGKNIAEARDILQFTERACSADIGRVLDSAVANAGNNNDIPPEELYVSECFADEGPTLKRFRPRARGRATPIRKRTCHVTVVVSRMSTARLDILREREERGGGRPDAAASRARRVAKSKPQDDETLDDEELTDDIADSTDESTETSEATTDEVSDDTEASEVEAKTDDVSDDAAESESGEASDETADSGEASKDSGEASRDEDA